MPPPSIQIRQNPKLRRWSLVIGVIILVLMFAPEVIPSVDRITLYSIGSIAGLCVTFLGATGSDTRIFEGGIKLGYTDLTTSMIHDVHETENALVLVPLKPGRRYRLKRRHYHPDDWQVLRKHTLALA